MVNIAEKTIDDYFDELHPDVKSVKFYEGKIEIDVVRAVPAVDFTATEWDDFLSLFVYNIHLNSISDPSTNKCVVISPEGEPTFALTQDDLGVTIVELNQDSRNRALLRQFGEDIKKTPYEFLFPYGRVKEEVVKELNEWSNNQKEKYFDIMVMQEVQRRNGVDFVDFWLKKGKELKADVEETYGRKNPSLKNL